VAGKEQSGTGKALKPTLVVLCLRASEETRKGKLPVQRLIEEARPEGGVKLTASDRVREKTGKKHRARAFELPPPRPAFATRSRLSSSPPLARARARATRMSRRSSVPCQMKQ
jgi:hypothetical protein